MFLQTVRLVSMREEEEQLCSLLLASSIQLATRGPHSECWGSGGKRGGDVMCRKQQATAGASSCDSKLREVSRQAPWPFPKEHLSGCGSGEAAGRLLTVGTFSIEHHGSGQTWEKECQNHLQS